MKSTFLYLFLTSFLIFLIMSCGEKEDAIDSNQVLTKAKNIFAVLPDKMPGSENDTPELISLGKKLYFDERLSVNDQQSCNTCHELEDGMAGVDNLTTSPGTLDGALGTRNSPTVLNAGFQFVQFWDGRAADLTEQAKGPILNPVEMGMPDSNAVIKKIGAIDEYKNLFTQAFPESKRPLTYTNLAEAIAAFERTLITHDRFDMFLNGNVKALEVDEVIGLELFIDSGCITCHIGPLLGGNMYQKMGLIKPYTDTKDLGRYEVTENDIDKFMFKVPILRNIALTGPYFHDGAIEDIKEAVMIMSEIQLGKTLTEDEAMKIVRFFNALTDTKLEKENSDI